MSLRYPESLVKKNWPEPTRWIRQSNNRGFMVGKLLDSTGFLVVWCPWWLNDWFFFLLSVHVYLYWYHYDILKISLKQLNNYLGSGKNEKLPPRRIPTVGIVRKVLSTPNTTNPQTSPPWWCRLPLLRHGMFGYARSDAGDLFRRGWPRAHTLGLI